MTYLEETNFGTQSGTEYSIAIDHSGVIVYSECCASRMSEETARKVYAALGRWLDNCSNLIYKVDGGQLNGVKYRSRSEAIDAVLAAYPYLTVDEKSLAADSDTVTFVWRGETRDQSYIKIVKTVCR